MLATAAEPTVINVSADAWVNSTRPLRNYGTASEMRVTPRTREAHLRFRIGAWRGLAVRGMELRLYRFSGDPAGLAADVATGSWGEYTLNWNRRPSAGVGASVGAAVRTDYLSFPLAAFFPTGVIDRDVVTLRIFSPTTAGVAFAARESGRPAQLVRA